MPAPLVQIALALLPAPSSTPAAVVVTALAAGACWLWDRREHRTRHEPPPALVPADPAPAGPAGTSPRPDAESMTNLEMALFAHEHGLCAWCPDPESDPQYCPSVLEAVDEDATDPGRHPPPSDHCFPGPPGDDP